MEVKISILENDLNLYKMKTDADADCISFKMKFDEMARKLVIQKCCM